MALTMESPGNPYQITSSDQGYASSSSTPATYNGVPPEFRESVHYMESTFSDNLSGTVFIRISIPELKVQKCLQFELDESVWHAKQRLLNTFAKDLKDAINFGLYCPPMNGRAGKFLEEERFLREYPLQGPIGFLEFKYKKRVYKLINLNPRKLKQINTKGNFKHFMDYVKNCNTEKVNKLTIKGLDPNFHDSHSGETPLTVAVTLNTPKCRELIMTLVGGGAHLDYRNRKGLTPLHKAVLAGNSDAVKTLLDLGLSPNVKDARSLTAVYYCVANACNPACLEILLMEKALLGSQDEQGFFEIHQASQKGLSQHLEHILFYGADVNIQNVGGNTPLHVAAIANQESCVRLLLFRGANKYIVNHSNQTPSQAAIIAQNNDIADIIDNFKDEDIVLYREAPKFTNRRRDTIPPMSMYGMSRSRSDPRINNVGMIRGKPLGSAQSTLSLGFLNNNYSENKLSSYETESSRSMSVSSASSGPGLELQRRLSDFRMHMYNGALKNGSPDYYTGSLPIRSRSMYSSFPSPSKSPSIQSNLSSPLLNIKETENESDSDMAAYDNYDPNSVFSDPNHFSYETRQRLLHMGPVDSFPRRHRFRQNVGRNHRHNNTWVNSHRHSSASVQSLNFDNMSTSSVEFQRSLSCSFQTFKTSDTHIREGTRKGDNFGGTVLNEIHEGTKKGNSFGGSVIAQKNQENVLNLNTTEIMYVCMKPYEARDDNELSLVLGEVIEVTGASENGMWEGRNASGVEGYFPADSVQEVRLRRRAGSLGDLMRATRETNQNRNTLAALERPYG